MWGWSVCVFLHVTCVSGVNTAAAASPPHCLQRCCAGLVTGQAVYRLLCRNFGSWGCSEHGCLLQSVQGVVIYRVEHLVPSRLGLASNQLVGMCVALSAVLSHYSVTGKGG